MKIADFGMLRHTYGEIYEVKQTKKLPIKWTAPEALFYGRYTSKSDVYVCSGSTPLKDLVMEYWKLSKKYFTDNTVKKFTECRILDTYPSRTRDFKQFFLSFKVQYFLSEHAHHHSIYFRRKNKHSVDNIYTSKFAYIQ